MKEERAMNRPVRRALAPLALALLAAACLAAPASAGMRLEAWKGSLVVGYAKVFSDSLAPAGSISVGGGVEYPLSKNWLLGGSMAFNLLGSSIVTRGSVTAALDYSMFDAALLATWLPPRGPFARVSFGPGIASAHADLAVAGGGALFRDLPVDEVVPEFAAQATIMSRKPKIVAVGIELGTRIAAVEQCTWTLFTARLAIHF
jgi:hypothetical protein